jgi:hypothetical protein
MNHLGDSADLQRALGSAVWLSIVAADTGRSLSSASDRGGSD